MVLVASTFAARTPVVPKSSVLAVAARHWALMTIRTVKFEVAVAANDDAVPRSTSPAARPSGRFFRIGRASPRAGDRRPRASARLRASPHSRAGAGYPVDV